MRVVFTPRAERHAEDLYNYIADRGGENRADGYISRIVAFCEGLATVPLRGQQPDDLLAGLRTTGFERSVTIAFVVTSDVILIEGIFYRGRDIGAIFKIED